MMIYLVLHTDMYIESAAYPVSLHTSKRGAFKAMMKHKWQEWYKDRESHHYRKPWDYLRWHAWCIKKMEVQG